MSIKSNSNEKNSLRAAMPITAAWIDELRASFGADQIDPSIKAGMKGARTFYAKENGHEIGNRPHTAPLKAICLTDMVLAPSPSEKNAVNSLKNARRGK